jgi:hypothetical protein
MRESAGLPFPCSPCTVIEPPVVPAALEKLVVLLILPELDSLAPCTLTIIYPFEPGPKEDEVTVETPSKSRDLAVMEISPAVPVLVVELVELVTSLRPEICTDLAALAVSP